MKESNNILEGRRRRVVRAESYFVSQCAGAIAARPQLWAKCWNPIGIRGQRGHAPAANAPLRLQRSSDGIRLRIQFLTKTSFAVAVVLRHH